jgi:hypothetical protein
MVNVGVRLLGFLLAILCLLGKGIAFSEQRLTSDATGLAVTSNEFGEMISEKADANFAVGDLALTIAEQDGMVVSMNLNGFIHASLLVQDLTFPHDVVCRDGKIFFNEHFVNERGKSPFRLWRYDMATSKLTSLATWRTLRPSGMALDKSGNLYFGTIATTAGRLTDGVWVILDALTERPRSPQMVISGERFVKPFNSEFAAVRVSGFFPNGDMLILDNPSISANFKEPGRMLRAARVDNNYVLMDFLGEQVQRPVRPTGAAFRLDGSVLLTDFVAGKVLLYGADGGSSEFATLSTPNQITVGSDDKVYVTNAVFNGDDGEVQGGLFVYNNNGTALFSVEFGKLLRGVDVCR